jgi:inosose dehydratase
MKRTQMQVRNSELTEVSVNSMMTRRRFVHSAALISASAAVSPMFAAKTKQRNIQIGHTGITWPNGQADQAVAATASLGFYGFETFGDVLVKWEDQGGFGTVLEKNHIPLISGYCTVNLTEPEKRADEMAKAVKWCGLIKKNQGRIFVVGPNPVKRTTYDFAANKANIVSTLNELAKTVQDQGLTPVLHQHTGTCVESRDETYAVLESVDTTHLKFGPDVGQLTKGGQDAVKVVKDFLPIVEHMHLKDYGGKDDHLLGYCPLGQGKVDVPAILDIMDGRKISGMVMVELDNDWHSMSPTPPAELVKQSHDYLESQGVQFRRV